MNITFSKLEGFHVKTESGQEIGKISDCVIDRATHGITHYEAKTGHLTNRKIKLIHISQVVKITQNTVIVKDGLISAEEKIKKQKTHPLPQGISVTDI